ncbi:rRNA-processing protein utp21 [Saitoella coloradoensis]
MSVEQTRQKRRRHAPSAITHPTSSLVKAEAQRPSRIFSPFRSIGHVSNHTPLDIQVRGAQYLVTTSVGRAFQTYDAAKLNLLFVGLQAKAPIAALKSHGNIMFAASENKILAYKRGKLIFTIEPPTANVGTITHLEVFGDYVIAATDVNHIITYRLTPTADAAELWTHITLPSKSIRITALAHPPTYLNKIFVGFSNGKYAIWNIRTGRQVYTSPAAFPAAITCVSHSPVIDVLGIGCADGTVLVHNVKADETYLTFKAQHRITALSFRTDGPQHLATATSNGDICIWDLNKSKILHVVRNAHSAAVTSVQFLNGQPVMVSASPDNSLKEWIFDSLESAVPRVLRQRSGHSAPSTKIRFYGPASHWLLSGSRDKSLRGFSLWNDSQTTELSQGPGTAKLAASRGVTVDEVRLSEIVAVAAATAREKDWDNVLTAHKDDNAARTWNWQSRRLGAYTLPTSDKTAVKSVAVSVCGNFGMVGSSGGVVDMYNLQSGIWRRKFEGASKAVTGVVSDGLNKHVITTSLDGKVRFYNFNSGVLETELDMGSAVTSTELQRSSDLLALACDDLSLRIIDIETRKVVRELWGHTNRITDIAFTPDGRWLISASLDSTIRTWDLPTGHLIDGVRVGSICTSLAFSPTGDFLATVHVDGIGINLWTNRSQFVPVSARHMTESEITAISMPSVGGEGGAGLLDAAFEEAEEESTEGDFESAEQLSEKMLTLSLVPRSRWQTLLNLETIKMRNKPKEAPKVPEKAPFFLPTTKELSSGAFVEDAMKVEVAGSADGKKGRKALAGVGADFDTEGPFARLLREGNDSGDFSAFIDYLKSLPPSTTDLEIRSLQIRPPLTLLILFIRALTSRLRSKRDYELVQAWMATFLKIHGDVLVANRDDVPELRRALEAWRGEQEREGRRLGELVGYTAGVIGYIRGQ